MSMRAGRHRPGGIADTQQLHYGVHIDGPEYQDLDSHFGFYGAKVQSIEELQKALTEALAATSEGRTAIVNAIMTT
jgi:hypothetical protein